MHFWALASNWSSLWLTTTGGARNIIKYKYMSILYICIYIEVTQHQLQMQYIPLVHKLDDDDDVDVYYYY